MTYCGWKKSCTTLDGWNPINTGINHLPNGAGFLPSTVCSKKGEQLAIAKHSASTTYLRLYVGDIPVSSVNPTGKKPKHSPFGSPRSETMTGQVVEVSNGHFAPGRAPFQHKNAIRNTMNYHAGWWFQPYPSEKWWSSSVGMMTFPTEWKVIIQSCSSHHQAA